MSRMKLGGQRSLRCLTLGRLRNVQNRFEHSVGGIKSTTDRKQHKSVHGNHGNTVGRLNKNSSLTQDNGRSMIFETLEKGQVKVAESFGPQFGLFGQCRCDSLLWRFDWGSVGTYKAPNSPAVLKRSAMSTYASLSTAESSWMFPFAFSLHFHDCLFAQVFGHVSWRHCLSEFKHLPRSPSRLQWMYRVILLNLGIGGSGNMCLTLTWVECQTNSRYWFA